MLMIFGIGQKTNRQKIPNQKCFLKFFQDRYYNSDNKEFQKEWNERLWKPNSTEGTKKDCRDEVEHVIKGDNENDVLSAFLVLIYRIRNNLFHGVKQGFDLTAQLEVLPIANRVLLEALKLQLPSE
jgi:hypothetical protein